MPTQLPELEIIDSFAATLLHAHLQGSGGYLLTVLDVLTTPLSTAFDSPPVTLMENLKRLYPGTTPESLNNLKVYPGKIRDFAISLKEMAAADPELIVRDYNKQFLNALKEVVRLTETSILDYFTNIHFEISANNLKHVQNSVSKSTSEGSLGFIFRALIFSKYLYPIYSDPYKAPIGYVRIDSINNDVNKTFLYTCPMPYYDEVLGLYPAFTQILLYALQSCLESTSARANTYEKIANAELLKLNDELKYATNSKFVEYISPHTWS